MENLYIGLGYLSAALGAGLVLVGAGFGIARIASSACEGTARQPEAAQNIRTTMIIAAALIEGLAFFALIVCLLSVMNFSKPETGAQKAKLEVSRSK